MDQKKILIVEDEQSLRDAIRTALDYEGFSVYVAVDGKDGLKKALNEKPDLIILDVVMPTMDGLEMFKQLRADSWGKDVQVIVMTVVDDVNKMADFVAYGSRDYILKTNISLAEVVKKVKDRLNLKI